MTSQARGRNGHPSPTFTDGLGVLRTELDRIDDHLIDTLRDRIECCVSIAYFKREHKVPMMQPHRIGIVQQRVARSAENHGIDPNFLRRLYGLIILETCRIEELIIGAASATSPEHPADRRSYSLQPGGASK